MCNNAVIHNGSTSYPSISVSSELSEGVELVTSSPISVPSVSGDSSQSVTTARLPTNGQCLDQIQDSVGSTFEVVVDNAFIECEPSNGTSHITNVSNTDTNSGKLSGIQDGENLACKQVQATTLSPKVYIQKPAAALKRSPLAELLVYPTPTQKKAKPKSLAHVLTSAESIALLEEKLRKKQEEKEEKERKKKERERKKKLREEEKERKAQEREAKKAKQQTKKKECGQKRANEIAGTRSKRQRVGNSVEESQDTGIQHREVSTNECVVCFGLYEDDPDSAEWIQCTNEDCMVWSHAECLEMCEDAYVCIICEALLL